METRKEKKVAENKIIQFIKPCRAPTEGHRLLTPEYTLEVLKQKRIVQINLDNCSIRRMENLSIKPTMDEVIEQGLLPLVEILQKGNVCLTAIGIHERPHNKVAKAKLAYENFCANFWPNHRNDVEATHRTYDETSTDRNVNFKSLDDGARCLYGCGYISLLQIQNIRKKYAEKSPEEQFEIYIHSIIIMLDIVSVFELELAKYAFWFLTVNEERQLPDNIRLRRKDIKENFTKLQNNLEKCKHFSFNGTMDIHWLSSANFAEDLNQTFKLGTTEFLLDNWVGTNDNKLYRISKDIHSVYYEGSTMKQLATSREKHLKSSKYWEHVDSVSDYVLMQRKRSGYRNIDNLLERIDRSVVHLEDELSKFFSYK